MVNNGINNKIVFLDQLFIDLKKKVEKSFVSKHLLNFFQFQFGGFNNMMFADPSRPFNNPYKCYSVSMLPGNERNDVEKGGKSKESQNRFFSFL